MWSTGDGNGKPLQYSCLENPMNSMRRQNDRILKEELPRSVGIQYATGDQWRNNSRKNEGMKPKQKQYPVVDVTSDRSEVRCCKEQYCIGTWNVRSMNQSKLEEAEVEQFYEDLQDLLELTSKECPFHYRGLEAKVGSQETPGVTGKFGLGQIWPWSTE